MTYSGQVRPGGPVEVRDLDALSIAKFAVSQMNNNVYLLRCRATGEQLLIDAADDADRILEVAGEAGISTVVTTHRHWDHIRALETVVDRSGAESLAHPADAPAIPVVTRTVGDGETIAVGQSHLEVIHLVGHTPGAIAVLYRDPDGSGHLFTGDSLFPGGIGKTGSPEDFDSLITDVEEKIFAKLGDDTWVYPGHGDDTTLGAERPHLPQWKERRW